MFSLKTKAVIYQLTEVFLADKEEEQYMSSEEAKRQIEDYLDFCDGNRSWAEDLVRGSWEAHHGFVRPLSMVSFYSPRFLFSPIGFILETLTILPHTIKFIFKK